MRYSRRVWGIIPRGAAIENSRYSSGCFLGRMGKLAVALLARRERGNRWNVARPGIQRIHVYADTAGTGTSAGTDTAGTNVVMKKVFVQVCLLDVEINKRVKYEIGPFFLEFKKKRIQNFRKSCRAACCMQYLAGFVCRRRCLFDYEAG